MDRCYICGQAPVTMNVQTFSDPEPVLIPGGWDEQGEDHTHALRPPTPAELEQAGHEALRRIQEDAG